MGLHANVQFYVLRKSSKETKLLNCSQLKWGLMSRKTRNILKALAILIVLLAVLMQLQVIIIPAISIYKFWMVIAAFATVLLVSK